MLHKVPVHLGERSYSIEIGTGLLAGLGNIVERIKPGARCAIVSDENVASHYLTQLEAALGGEANHLGSLLGSVVLPAGESTKCYGELERLTRELLELGVERNDMVIAFGGGVIGDLAGFASSILRRGVDFVQVPTSLLAQVDSSVGGKTGINTPEGKNLIGTFCQPRHVTIDIDVLKTLPERQLRAGFAEVIKYGLLGDAAFFDWLSANGKDVLTLNENALSEAIRISCEAKARVVAEDEKEGGRRALLNLGHTFGHALEAHAGYCDRLLHGEAISIGMCLAFDLSAELELCSGQDAGRVPGYFSTVGLPTRISDVDWTTPPTRDDLMSLMMQDKKVERGKLKLILARAIGDAFVCDTVTHDQLSDFLDSKLNS